MGRLTETIKVRADSELLEALERQAAEEGRDLSQLVRVILRRAMIAAGRLEEAIARD